MSNRHFSRMPNIDIPRTRMRMTQTHSTSFNFGKLIPIGCVEVLPGDSFGLKLSSLIRMTQPIVPIMDTLECSIHAFFVPLRLVYKHTEEFFGENKDSAGYQQGEFKIPMTLFDVGVVMYLDSENWLKGSIEYENDEFQHLGSVATNNGYSDWATTELDAGIKSMWYRFSRREDDFCIECSEDGIKYKQMRICHMYKATGEIQFGIYACSPENSSFKATFTNMEITECKWLAHDGQAPDEE